MYITIYLIINLSRYSDWFIFLLLQIMLQWTQACIYVFKSVHLSSTKKNYDFGSYIQVFNPFWVYFVYCIKQWSIHSFVCHCPVFLIPFIEKSVLSQSYIFGSSVINLLTIYIWVYFCLFSLFIVCSTNLGISFHVSIILF